MNYQLKVLGAFFCLHAAITLCMEDVYNRHGASDSWELMGDIIRLQEEAQKREMQDVLSFSHDNSSSTKEVEKSDKEQLLQKNITQADQSPIISIKFSPNQSFAATKHHNGTIKIWDCHDPEQLVSTIVELPLTDTLVSISNDGKSIRIKANSGLLQLWDISSRANPKPCV